MLQRLAAQAKIGIFLVRADLEAEAGHQLEHAAVFHQHQAVQFLEALVTRHVHDGQHQARAQALAAEAVVDHQREFAAAVVRVGNVARYAQHTFGLDEAAVRARRAQRLHGHQRHFAVVVDQRVLGQHRHRQFAQRRCKAVVARFFRQPAHEVLQHGRVVRLHRAQRVQAGAAQRPVPGVRGRVGQDGQVVVLVRRWRRGVDHDARIDGHGAVFIDDQRVDVHLAQLRQFAHHFRHAQQNVFDRLALDGRSAAPFAQRIGGAHAADQALRQELVQRRQLGGAVGQQLDHGAARAKADRGAEQAVGGHADEQLAAVALAGHLLQRDAVDGGVGPQAAHGGQHVVVGVAHGGGGQHAQRHALHVGLVRNVGRIDFHGHRVAELAGDQHRLVGAAGHQGGGDRNVERGQQRLRFHFGQHLAALGQHAFDQQARAVEVGVGQLRQRRRGLVQQLLVLVERGDVGKTVDGRLGRAERGQASLVDDVSRLDHLRVAHPARKQRLAQAGIERADGLRHGSRIAAELGRINHQDAVHLAVARAGQHRFAVGVGAGVLAQVEQVGQGGVFGHQRAQRIDAGRGQARQLQAQLVDPVGRQHAGTAAVGDHGQAWSHRAVARRQAFGRREQLHERFHTDCPGAAQRRVEHDIAEHHGARVRERRLRGGRGVARLEHDHRLGVGRAAQGGQEAARIGQPFHADDDALGGGIGGQEVQRLRQVDGRVGPERHHRGQPHRVLVGPVEDGGRQRARLRDQRQAAGPRQGTGHAGVQVQARALVAEAVGAEQVNLVAFGDAHQRGGQRRIDTGRQDQRRAALDAAGHLQRKRQLVVRQRDHGQVGARLRQVGQGARHADVEIADRAGKAALFELAADAAAIGGLAVGLVLAAGEHDDGLGGKQRVEVVGCSSGRQLTERRPAGHHRHRERRAGRRPVDCPPQAPGRLADHPGPGPGGAAGARVAARVARCAHQLGPAIFRRDGRRQPHRPGRDGQRHGRPGGSQRTAGSGPRRSAGHPGRARRTDRAPAGRAAQRTPDRHRRAGGQGQGSPGHRGQGQPAGRPAPAARAQRDGRRRRFRPPPGGRNGTACRDDYLSSASSAAATLRSHAHTVSGRRYLAGRDHPGLAAARPARGRLGAARRLRRHRLEDAPLRLRAARPRPARHDGRRPAGRAARCRQPRAGDPDHRVQRAGRPGGRAGPGRRRLPGQTVRAGRNVGPHPRGRAARRRPRQQRTGACRYCAEPGNQAGHAGRPAGRAHGPRIPCAVRADAAQKQHRAARPDRGKPVRLGRRGGKQRHRSIYLQPAQKTGQRQHRHRARPRLPPQKRWRRRLARGRCGGAC
uniref:Uncharacterized protein n=1 Tax=Tanacetum cinerariifolium TaxID=118510 RepID=A0A699GFN0_TANCI|nr:hypothetical protein [Tanacetum cinerariifolium]